MSWCYGNGEACGVEVLVKGLCGKAVEVGRVSNRVMAIVLALEGEVLRLICGYAPQCGRSVVEECFQ